ncbi:protein kinase [Frankia sp. CNm7]|uniref:WD40 repeat domain-containing serine/threonine protein kinase n=1 Tax=Frankia nepalensis TaxID=1836974 RepID=UPI001933199B|nr:serine/threonine-protein kinase [Frankia nepalensis]MBL7524603.1 protein kinase [Frankia nepalensis]
MVSAAPLDEDDPTSVGPYDLVGRLGDGGMGSVYLARRRPEPGGGGGPGPLVALKVIRADLARIPEFRERFLREARSAQRVARFCTAEVIDVSTVGRRPYLVTEFIDGPTLFAAVRERGALPPAELERLAVAVASALTAIHAAGIIHRDLKPGNILLSASGARVIDFGISRALDATVTLTRGSIGTPGFMAPEQALGRPVTAAADVYAWGAVVLFAASGRPPFDGDSTPVVLRRVVEDEPDLAAVHEALRPLVARVMSKVPEERPAADELLLALHRLAAAPAAVPSSDEATVVDAAARPASSQPVATPVPLAPTPPPSAALPPAVTRPTGRGRGDAAAPSWPTPPQPSVGWPEAAEDTRADTHLAGGWGPSDPVPPPGGAGQRTGGDERGREPSRRRRRLLLAMSMAVVVAVAFVVAVVLIRPERHDGESGAGASRNGPVPSVADLPAQVGQVHALAFAGESGSDLLATGGDDGRIRLWDTSDVTAPKQLAEVAEGSASQFAMVQSLVFSPDGRLLASGAFSSSIRLWDVSDPTRPREVSCGPVEAGIGPVRSLAFTDDGEALVAGGFSGARVWDVAAPACPAPTGPLLSDGGPVALVGDLLVTGGEKPALWDVANPAEAGQLAELPVDGDVEAVALSRDARTLVLSVGGADAVEIWDVSDPRAPARRAVVSGGATDLAFTGSNYGVTFAAASTESPHVLLWRVSELGPPVPLGRYLAGDGQGVAALVVARDSTVATGETRIGADGEMAGVVRLWTAF